ncbi:acylphosphatase [Acinetobacter variabilis]|uniref:acylphosphatase n=1 Tax=Acinetobacter variabilis TaxID=70346 RepID=UPI00289942CA|nr:acylphosphatase [Acinetobacter variabilis]
MQAIHLIIQGKVQGVGYRRWFEQQAIQLGLKGFVRNLETGEVEAVIVGKEAIVREMIQFSRTGPQGAEVTAIHQQSLNLQDTDFQDFKVLTKD